MLVAIPLRSHPLLFNALNSSSEPVSDSFFDFVLITASVERIQRLTRYIEWNVAAWNLFGAALGWH
jgi:hypothetical protein